MAVTKKKAAEKKPAEENAEAPKKRSTKPVELLPCPFCGKAPKLARVTVGSFTTWEIRCSCTKRDDLWVQFAFESEEQAVKFWQKRGGEE